MASMKSLLFGFSALAGIFLFTPKAFAYIEWTYYHHQGYYRHHYDFRGYPRGSWYYYGDPRSRYYYYRDPYNYYYDRGTNAYIRYGF